MPDDIAMSALSVEETGRVLMNLAETKPPLPFEVRNGTHCHRRTNNGSQTDRSHMRSNTGSGSQTDRTHVPAAQRQNIANAAIAARAARMKNRPDVALALEPLGSVENILTAQSDANLYAHGRSIETAACPSVRVLHRARGEYAPYRERPCSPPSTSAPGPRTWQILEVRGDLTTRSAGLCFQTFRSMPTASADGVRRPRSHPCPTGRPVRRRHARLLEKRRARARPRCATRAWPRKLAGPARDGREV